MAPIERKNLVDLDSSTQTKFSRHWILHLPIEQGHCEALFPNNIRLGKCIQHWIGRLADAHSTGRLRTHRPLLDRFLFLSNSKSCLIDTGVYTRNRVFRLLGSRKFGKPQAASLRIAASNQFPLGITNENFYTSAQEIEPSKSVNDSFHTDIDERIQNRVRQTDWTLHAEALAHSLVVPLNVDKLDCPILPVDEEQQDGPGSSHQPQPIRRSAVASNHQHRGTSLYPVLDAVSYTHLTLPTIYSV